MTAALLALWLATADETAALRQEPQPGGTIWAVPVGHSLALLGGMRLGLSVFWPDAYDPRPFGRSGRSFARSWTRPPRYDGRRSLFESDGDPWTINVLGHGLFGAEVHGRVRSCGGGFWTALAFTAGTSLAWEYGVEAFSQRPSALDLVATPILGAALGEGRHFLLLWTRRWQPGPLRRVVRILVDPLGEAERGWLRTRC